MKQTEAEITGAIRHHLDILGVYHWKQWQGPMSQPKGVADILGILPENIGGSPGRFLAIEVKKPGGRLSADQADFLNKVQHAGGVAMVATSVDQVIDKLGVRDRFLF